MNDALDSWKANPLTFTETYEYNFRIKAPWLVYLDLVNYNITTTFQVFVSSEELGKHILDFTKGKIFSQIVPMKTLVWILNFKHELNFQTFIK
jgi:hypothetical protein